MTKRSNVKAQLHHIGVDFRFWGRSEARELENILFDDEIILHAINGRYNGGLGLLCATDRRLLLLDKKPLFLTFEDMQYEMISEVDYTEQTLCARLTLMTPAKALSFKSYRLKKLRNLTQFIQQRVSRSHDQQEGYIYGDDQDDRRRVQQQPSRNGTYSQLGAIATNIADDSGESNLEPRYSPRQAIMYPMNPYRNVGSRSRRRIPKFTTLPPHYQS